MPTDLLLDGPCVNVPLYAIRHAQIGGTEFGIYNLVKGLTANKARVSVTYGRDGDLSPEFLHWLGQGAQNLRVVRQGGVPGPKNVRFLEEFLFSLRRTNDDWAIFPNYFCPPRLGSAKRRHCVILHDIQYKMFPQFHSSKRRAWLDAYLPRMFKQADQVILISQSEAELVRKYFGDDAAAKCAVVPNAVDWSRFHSATTKLSPEVTSRLGRRYVLSVCHLFPHKNVATLLQAFARISAHDDELRLYLVGSASEKNRAFVKSMVPESALDRVEILGFIDDLSLGAYYEHASLFALPSLYEGFGMPAVEAMGFGIPTLVSRCFALPEVTFGAARYVDDPLDAAEWQKQILAALARPAAISPESVDRVRVTYAPAAVGERMLTVLSKHG